MMASPFFFVRKKDGTLRPVQDYHKLNSMTIKNRYPLPLIQELINKFRGAKIFSKMDVRWGYNNIRIKEGNKEKAVFRTNRGLFEPTIMFFGMTNSPATFQAFMNRILKDLIDNGHVIVYLDDILVFTNTIKEHRRIVNLVLEHLRKEKLFLKPKKCEFEVSTVEYLGVIIGNGEVHMDPAKVAIVCKWQTPHSKKGVQTFLGFCNFYRHFIKGFSGVAKPLTSLMGNVPWVWTNTQQRAFDELKHRISEEPVLLLPDDHSKFRVEADSSDYANGAVLSQKVDSKWRPIAFRSQSLSAVERNYEIYDKEMMAIMDSLDDWRQYLLGAELPFEVWSDHKNLTYFRKPQKLNRRQAQWLTELAEYDMELLHKPGSQMGKANALSRVKGLEKGENDNKDVTLLKSEFFIQTMEIEAPKDEIIDTIQKCKNNRDIYVQRTLDQKLDGWRKDNDLILWEHCIYVPKDKQLRSKIITMHHDAILRGHPGQYKTLELITRNYWWPGIKRNVTRYVNGCIRCQETKKSRTRPVGLLQPHEPPTEPPIPVTGWSLSQQQPVTTVGGLPCNCRVGEKGGIHQQLQGEVTTFPLTSFSLLECPDSIRTSVTAV